jgi:predicted RNA-binding Zn ribbon-like protein
MVSSALSKTAVAPDVELLVDFVNTRDVEEGTDALARPEDVRGWIEERGGDYVAEPDSEDARRLRSLRESLRALMRANNGVEPGPGALAPLREAAERSRYRSSVSAAGTIALAPARSDLSGFEARLLLALERVQSQGAWPRLKACTGDGCQWAFYDSTRNRSRTWCSMEECGNREKTRRYRQRMAPISS